MELFVFPVAEVVAAAERVADAQQHVPVADGEEIGAGDVFVDRDAFDRVGHQIADVVPLAGEAWGFDDARSFPAEDGVIGVAFDPAERIPGVVFVVVWIAGLGFRGDRIGVEFLPLVQFVVQRDGHRVALPDLVVTHGRSAVFVDETVAAEHAGDQSGWMMSPVQQIGARYVSPVVASGVLEDIEEVVSSFPEDSAVGIEGHPGAFGNDEVIARPMRIGQQALPELPRGVDRAVKVRGVGLPGQPAGDLPGLHGYHGAVFAVEDQPPVVDAGPADQ